MEQILSRWTKCFAAGVASALIEFREHVTDQIECLAVDCHPWHGGLGLALLTTTEVAQDPVLADPEEMAAWKHYNFTASLAAWTEVSHLATEMREAYETAIPVHAGVAEAYLHACATAMHAADVHRALAGYLRSDTFRISVAHPDSHEEYFQ